MLKQPLQAKKLGSKAKPTVCKIAVLGAGAFGTALAFAAASGTQHTVYLYCRDKAQAETINRDHYNPKRNSQCKLPETIIATTDLEKCVHNAAIILHCIPAQRTYEFIQQFGHLVPSNIPYVCTSKGIHLETGMLMSDCLQAAFAGRATDNPGELVDVDGDAEMKNGRQNVDSCVGRAEIPLAFLSGPSFAIDIMNKCPVSVVVASHDTWAAKRIQKVLSTKYFRIYTTDDVIGVEVGGALKNPLAIGTGCAKGLGFGQSTIASIVTRACMEMSALSAAMGGRKETLTGLSGFGDLMLTCYSDKSRNNRFGQCLAKGMSASEAIDEIGEVVEGFPTAKEVVKLAKRYHLTLPLFFAVESLLSGRRSPKELFNVLLESQPGQERFIG